MYKAIRYIRVRCHSNETRTPIANPPNSAQLEGTPYHSSKLRPGTCGSVGQTDTQTAVANVHFASAMPHTKYNPISLTAHRHVLQKIHSRKEVLAFKHLAA